MIERRALMDLVIGRRNWCTIEITLNNFWVYKDTSQLKVISLQQRSSNYTNNQITFKKGKKSLEEK
jgi:hypothetical protein